MEEEKTTEIQRKVDTPEVLNKIQEQLGGFSREPFRNELSRFLCFSPGDEAVQAHANKSPDRWSQAVTIVARLSGITDKLDDTNKLVLYIRLSLVLLRYKLRYLFNLSNLLRL